MPYRTVNGIRIRYELWGEGETPLVLLHGLGSSADDWLLQLPAFAPHFKCIPLDLRGHGASDKPAGRYSIALFAADVAQLLNQLALAPAHVLGLSLGGLVVQQLALEHAAVVRSLTLINTFPGFWPPPRELLRVLLRRRNTILQRQDMSRAAVSVADDLFPDSRLALLRDWTIRRLAANDADAYRRAMVAILRFWPGRRLDQVKLPALIIAGEEDRVVPRAYQERLRARLPHAEFVPVARSGHASNLDQPHVVNEAVLRFLLALEGRGDTRA
jgi:pimeloyl-ACP methyl ester carboxylesterase